MVGFSKTAVLLLGQALVVTSLCEGLLEGNSYGVPAVPATYDYVIVGGGNAGLTLANRLSESGKNLVAVIEAGGFYERDNGNNSQIPTFAIQGTGKDPEDYNPLIDWGFTTVPQPALGGNISHYARGKTLGGSTARNYMTYHMSTIGAYQKWADQVGDQSYTYANWLPFFKKSTTFIPPNNVARGLNATPGYDASTLGTSGPLTITFANYALALSTWIAKGLQDIGIPLSNGLTSGKLAGSSFALVTVNRKTGARDSSETAFLQPALCRPNLIVYHSALAKKILFGASAAGPQATGVRVQTGKKIWDITATKEVIVSAGTFQSPQLLMVSGIGPASTLNGLGIPIVKELPGVGQNLWDHVLFGPAYRVNVPTSSSFGDPAFFGQAVAEFRSKQGGILSSNGGDLIAYERLPNATRSTLPLSAQADLATFPADWPELEYFSIAGYSGYQNSIQEAPRDGFNYATLSVGIVKPLSRGNVSISSADTNDQPLINPNWLSHPTDQAVAVAGYKRARAAWTSPSLHNITIGPEAFPGEGVQTDDQILQLIKESVGPIYHPAATCAMGKSTDPNAVVDVHAKVFGVKGLRVVDASAFPFLPAGHPMSAVYALAEKIADNIANGL